MARRKTHSDSTGTLSEFHAAPCSASLFPLPGQPLCKHYTGATLDNLTGDYLCKCLAGIPYERWIPNMNRWPCRRRSILGLEQHTCALADYGTDPPVDRSWIADLDDVSCPRCNGAGTIIICIDDICQNTGECIHGDGEIPCPLCHGNG